MANKEHVSQVPLGGSLHTIPLFLANSLILRNMLVQKGSTGWIESHSSCRWSHTHHASFKAIIPSLAIIEVSRKEKGNSWTSHIYHGKRCGPQGANLDSMYLLYFVLFLHFKSCLKFGQMIKRIHFPFHFVLSESKINLKGLPIYVGERKL